MPYIIGALVLIVAVVVFLIIKKRNQLQKINESETEIRNIINRYNSELTDLCSRYVSHSDEIAFVQLRVVVDIVGIHNERLRAVVIHPYFKRAQQFVLLGERVLYLHRYLAALSRLI